VVAGDVERDLLLVGDGSRDRDKSGTEAMLLVSVWDPYIALTTVAARTDLLVGTCVALVGQHDPISLAKVIATLNVLSGGRFVLGVGHGWNREEFEDHRYSREVLRDVVREKVQLMRELWTKDVATFEGEHVRISPSCSWRTSRAPCPPVASAAWRRDWPGARSS